MVDDAGTLTYDELDVRATRLARAWAAAGVREGARVGLLCRNGRAVLEVQIAAGKLGADPVLFTTGMAASQLREVAAELELQTLVADADLAGAAGLPDGLPRAARCAGTAI